MSHAIHSQYDSILILDFGSQYSHLITRRFRELNVYCEMLPCTQQIKDLTWHPKGVILSGSPYSVYDEVAPRVDPAVFSMGVPVLGICYGLQEIAWNHGGRVDPHHTREYGHATLDLVQTGNRVCDALFAGLGEDLTVWMSHGDQLSKMPDNFDVIARTKTAPYAAIAHKEHPFYGIQFHAEVTHTAQGTKLFENFVTVCGCRRNWTMETFIDKEIARIREMVGPHGRVLGAISGGVDSSVAAKIMHEAIGDRFHAVMVDNGVLRMDEAKQVDEKLSKDLGVNLTVVDASDLFLERLVDVEDPERKRKIIGNTFIEVFEKEAERMEKEMGKYEYLLQGTLYPDVIESISFKGPSATIKTHHNVGGLLEDMKLKLIEPLRELFKDEVRALGRLMGIPEHLVGRHPFPGPGLAIRILGPVTRDQVKLLQHADKIYIEEIFKANVYNDISQAFAVLLPVRAVGVQGDKRTYDQVIALRAAQTTDFMTATWYHFDPNLLSRISNRITNEVQGVNRVVLDVSSKPPATIEWL
ncbi:GMP synthase (glutamine-hydrolyzing) [Malassezia vespertilionis]|uniref:GMP synthase [glutamine-hydrolyzing] n=1 Tax=Malassezia vespertilionis TaxID=2020962 RepID=A0A2N1JB79_9BASI|nr:GMP synthase (glutamine-hydrolyzing) [Malassezia vespertilionis]PKI83811.1 Gua1p [Malassezia vespertilionis]WFD07059.1 GMP synthase (glutamine-hydrolyzing) [Malassezia vespertilionis]